MCNAAWAGAASAIGSIGSAYFGYHSDRAAHKLQNKLHKENKKNAYSALEQGYLSAQAREWQETLATAQEIEQARLEAVQMASTANVISGESGVSGFSVERVLRDIGANASREIANAETNRDWTLAQVRHEALGLKEQTKGRILSVPKGIKPTVFPYIFANLGSGASGMAAMSGGGGGSK